MTEVIGSTIHHDGKPTVYAYMYENTATGETKVSVKPWKRDGTEKWPKNWIEYKLGVIVEKV